MIYFSFVETKGLSLEEVALIFDRNTEGLNLADKVRSALLLLSLPDFSSLLPSSGRLTRISTLQKAAVDAEIKFQNQGSIRHLEEREDKLSV